MSLKHGGEIEVSVVVVEIKEGVVSLSILIEIPLSCRRDSTALGCGVWQPGVCAAAGGGRGTGPSL